MGLSLVVSGLKKFLRGSLSSGEWVLVHNYTRKLIVKHSVANISFLPHYTLLRMFIHIHNM